MDSGSRRSDSREYAARLYRKHSKAVLAFLQHNRRMPADQAADLLQRTFQELITNLDRDPALVLKHPRSYLLKIAHRRFCAHSAGAEREHRHQDSFKQHLAVDYDDLSDLGTSLRREQKLLLRGLRYIGHNDPHQHQMILYLRCIAGLTQNQTALVLGLKRSTLSRRQQAATTRLRQAVAELAAPDDPALTTSTSIINGWHEALVNDVERLIAGPNQDLFALGEPGEEE